MGKVNYLIPEDIRRRTVDALGRYKSRLETEAAALARELGATEAMALLLEAAGQRRPAGKAKRFDL